MAHEFECSECGFMIRSDSEDELVGFVREHAQNSHGMAMDEGDIKSGTRTV